MNTINGLVKLEELWLDNNEIEELDEKFFESLSHLKRLVLNHNQLKEINRDILAPLKSIELLQL